MARQVVFLESSVPKVQVLAQGLAPGVDAVILDSAGDGLDEMGAFLQGQHGLDAIHLLSHGMAGSMEMGTAALDEAGPTTHADDLATLRAALAPHGDLLLWGCDVAAGAGGRAFLHDLARDTGADVAASAQRVGSTALGGTWSLDATVGDIRAGLPFTAAARSAFDEVLPWVQPATGEGPGLELHTATLLPNGMLFVAGGQGPSGAVAGTQLYDPGTGRWTYAKAMGTARSSHTATLLPSGQVLVTGGFDGHNVLIQRGAV